MRRGQRGSGSRDVELSELQSKGLNIQCNKLNLLDQLNDRERLPIIRTDSGVAIKLKIPDQEAIESEGFEV